MGGMYQSTSRPVCGPPATGWYHGLGLFPPPYRPNWLVTADFDHCHLLPSDTSRGRRWRRRGRTWRSSAATGKKGSFSLRGEKKQGELALLL
ncbi:hypothetical protein BHE74_00058780 [Ensete ventricosum]|nr:hypothetical protein BHE74_00058780 [Ensete ventricosum]RZR90309.1 hypothetical protein BHM03_00018179 [Ensete ventricosum]